MSKDTTINLCVNAEIKEQADAIFSEMGLSLSDAFNSWLHQVCIQRVLPAEPISYSYKPNAETLALIDRIESGEEEMAGPFETFEEYKAWLEEDDEDGEDE